MRISDWSSDVCSSDLLLDGPGAFGENIAASGLSEAELCLGDRFRLGTALVEVSQGRQPCWKLDHRFGRKDILATVVRTGKCGVYFRVIEEGVAQAGTRSEEHTSELQSQMRRPYDVFCLKKKKRISKELSHQHAGESHV